MSALQVLGDAAVAYRDLAMFEIKVVLERVGRGDSCSQVERVTGHARKTIGRMVKRAEALGCGGLGCR